MAGTGINVWSWCRNWCDTGTNLAHRWMACGELVAIAFMSHRTMLQRGDRSWSAFRPDTSHWDDPTDRRRQGFPLTLRQGLVWDDIRTREAPADGAGVRCRKSEGSFSRHRSLPHSRDARWAEPRSDSRMRPRGTAKCSLDRSKARTQLRNRDRPPRLACWFRSRPSAQSKWIWEGLCGLAPAQGEQDDCARDPGERKTRALKFQCVPRVQGTGQSVGRLRIV